MVFKSKKKLFLNFFFYSLSDPSVLSHQNVPDPNVFAVHTVIGLSYFFWEKNGLSAICAKFVGTLIPKSLFLKLFYSLAQGLKQFLLLT